MSRELLTPAIIHLNSSRKARFYGSILSRMTIETSSQVPTAGVKITDKAYLLINREFWDSLSLDSQCDVLIHECGHILFNHIGRHKQLGMQNKAKAEREGTYVSNSHEIFNVSADLALNQLIPGIETLQGPDGKPHEVQGISLARMRKQFPNLPEGKVMEYYYSYFMQNAPKAQGQPQLGEGNTPHDDHSGWDESDNNPEYIKHVCQGLANKAYEDAKVLGSAGNLPSDIMLALDQLNKRTRDWRNDLRQFVAQQMAIDVEYVRSKRNRRYGLMQPGKRREPKLHLVVPVDVSGSVSDKELSQFFSEIDRIHKQGAKVTVIEFDAEVQRTFEYDPKKKIEVLGRGGTRFKPAFEAAVALQPDGIICFTDGGDCGTDCVRPKAPTLWALSPGGENVLPYEWGRRVKVELF